MDYGQLAYIKAQTLEAYLNKTASAVQKTGCASAAFYPHTAAESGYTPLTIYGSGSVGLTVTLTLRAAVTVKGAKLRLYVGDKLAAYCSVSLDSGKTERSTLLATVYPSEGEVLRVVCDTAGLLIEEMFVLCEGAKVRLVSRFAFARCDGRDGKAFIAYAKDGDVRVRACDTEAETVAFKGGVFDLAVRGDGVYILGVDDTGNLVGITYDYGLQETSRTVLGQFAFDCVAIGQTGGELLLAGLQNRKTYFCTALDRFAGNTAFEPAAFATEADAIYLSKQSENSMLFLRRDDALYCKLPFQKLGKQDCICVTFGYEV
ncbi:MAG: hypothetical protein K2M95_06465 [Clostridiales bacterium]|nr:hypothetical protein [Clostridiales bacterium]